MPLHVSPHQLLFPSQTGQCEASACRRSELARPESLDEGESASGRRKRERISPSSRVFHLVALCELWVLIKDAELGARQKKHKPQEPKNI